MNGESTFLTDSVYELRCNLDDMTPEAVAFAMERLLEQGALDVYTAPIGMKKGRPGVMLCCLCRDGEQERFARLILRHTSTLGVRMHLCRRLMLRRSEQTVQTAYGAVRVKCASGPDGEKRKPEYDDLAQIARQSGKSLREIQDALTCERGKTE